MSPRMLSRSALLLAAIALLSGCLVYETSAGPPASRPVPPPPAPGPVVGVDINFFYDALRPDGDWLRLEPYGWVWVPNAVAPFWRPYTVGRWEWTDWGWTWISSERWGWATYHYGRWVRVNRYGWAWIPGDVWGPSWVAWRQGSGVVGWAPLPPEIHFHAGIGLDWGTADFDLAIGLDAWCFIDDVRFTDRDLSRYAFPVGRNTSVIRRTKNATRMNLMGGRIVNEGVDRAAIERETQHPIPLRKLIDAPGADRRTAEIVGDEIRVYRPEIRKGSFEPTPRPAPRAAQPPPPSEAKTIDETAERRWDRRWNEDWDKLEKAQKRADPDATGPASKMPPPVLKKVRDENMEAAENAYRELVAERERAKRQAERKPAEPAPPKSGKAKPKPRDDAGDKNKPKDKNKEK